MDWARRIYIILVGVRDGWMRQFINWFVLDGLM